MTIKWTENAYREAQEIFDYIESVAGTRRARKVIGEIHKCIHLLSGFPLGGQREELLEKRPEGFRRLIQGNYKVIYFIENDVVNIAAIFDCRRDPAALRQIVEK